MNKKIKRALEHETGFNFQRTKEISNNLPIRISTGALNFVEERQEEIRRLFTKPQTTSKDYYPYVCFTVTENKNRVFSFTIYGHALFLTSIL